jgi:hypothetical protein
VSVHSKIQGRNAMTKLNWDHVRQQQRVQRYGLEIDSSVGADPNKIPKYSDARGSHILKKILGSANEVNEVERLKR